MDPAVNGSEKYTSDSKETLEHDKEGTVEADSTQNTDSELPIDSHSEKADTTTSQDEKSGKCDVQERSFAAEETILGSVTSDSSTAAEGVESVKCLTETVQEENVTATTEKLRDEVSSHEVSQEKIEDTAKQETNLQQNTIMSSETSTVEKLSNSITEELSKFSSELISTQIIKQTMTSSSQETTVSNDSLSIDTDLQVNANGNLLDPEKVSELRSSPYYDSLIANRISMESQLPTTVQKKEEQSFNESDSALELDDECSTATGDRRPSEQEGQTLGKEDKTEKEEQGAASSASQCDFTAKTVSSLKDACQEAVKASSQVNDVHTATSGIFKVTKFEAKSFSEVKTSSEWSYEQSSLFKSEGDSLVSSQQTSDFASTTETQAESTDDMGVPPANEDVPLRFSPNAYKPPPEEEMDFADLPRKKKMFSSSSFYEEPNAIYPTVEEQVELCRKIADSLSNDSNKKSKGANMFFKRVKRAEKWVVESIGTAYDSDYEPSRAESVGTPDLSKAPYVRVSKGPTQLKLILDPRHLLDMKRLRQEGINIVEHNAVSPEICLDLVKDLNSPTGRGAQLFAKRKKKSEEWVVDEEKVRQLLREREGYTSSPEPPTTVPCGGGVEPLVYPRVQMVKSPWIAAMESPIGSCAGAFKDVHPNEVAESVIRAAETKVMTYPAPVRPVIEPVIKPESNVQLQNYPSSTMFTPAPVPFTPVAPATQQAPKRPLSTSSFKAGVYTADPYKPRAPRGWIGTSSGGSQYFSIQPSLPFAAQEPVQPRPQLQPQPQPQSQPQPQLQPQETPVQGSIPSVPSYKLVHQPSVMRSYSFANFNKSPRAWSEAASGFQNIKSVKPPSVLVQ